jgi:hypothetical protein
MNFHVHLSIADALVGIIEDELSTKLNKPAFFFGSVKPDLFPNIITAEHEIRYAKQFITDEINSLLQQKIEDTECSWDLSEKLGIVMHYLSDFFCYAHSEHYKGSMMQHYYYEFKHSKYFIKNFKTIIRNIRKKDSRYLDLNYFSSYIDEQYRLYSSKSPSAARDIVYSLKICSAVSVSLIAALSSEYQESKTEKVLLHSA